MRTRTQLTDAEVIADLQQNAPQRKARNNGDGNGKGKPQPNGNGKGKGSGTDDPGGEPKAPIDEWDEKLMELVNPEHKNHERNIIRRQVIAATIASDLGLRVSEHQTRKRLLALQRNLITGTEERGTAGGQKVKISRKEWIVDGLIAAGCCMGIAAYNKVGKTKLASAIAASLIFGHPLMGNPDWRPQLGGRKILLWWVDQPAADSAEYLKAVGLMTHDGILHPQIIRLYTEEDDLAWDDHGMDVLLDHVAKHPGMVLITDSFFHCVQRLYGSDQEAEAGGALIDVQTALVPAGITHLCLFHSAKETGPVGINAIRGHSSAGGAVSACISLHFLERKCPSGSGRWVADKENPHRRMVVEGRAPFRDLLVKLDAPAGTWELMGDFSKAIAALTADDHKAGTLERLTDAQREVLDALAGLRAPNGATVKQVAHALHETPNRTQINKAKTRLDALVKAELVSKSSSYPALYRLRPPGPLTQEPKTSPSGTSGNPSGEEGSDRVSGGGETGCSRVTPLSAYEHLHPTSPPFTPQENPTTSLAAEGENRCTRSLGASAMYARGFPQSYWPGDDDPAWGDPPAA